MNNLNKFKQYSFKRYQLFCFFCYPTSYHSSINMKLSLFLFSTVFLGAHASLDKSLRGVSKMGKAGKTDVCHYDEDEGTFKTISISDNALDAHKKHGDFVCDGLDNIVGCDAVDGCVCVEGYDFKGEDGCIDSCADMDCDDNDVETADTCSLGVCSNVDSCAGVDCEDNDPETVDTCSQGVCSNVNPCPTFVGGLGSLG